MLTTANVLSPSDLIALFSAVAGSAYSAHFKLDKITSTFALRFVTSLQASTCFLLAFAHTQYLGIPADEGSIAGVKWTEQHLTTALPVVIYLVMLGCCVIGAFHIILEYANNNKKNFISHWISALIILLIQCFVSYHAMTLEITPTNKELFSS